MAEPFVGKELSSREFTVTGRLLADYHNGLALTPRADGKVPTSIASDAESAYFNEIAFANHVGHLWMRQGWECFAPVTAGETYKTGGRIRDIYPHRDRSVVYYEVEVEDAAGRLMFRTHHHQSFLRQKPAGGEVAFRDPSKKPGARKFAVPEGKGFGGLSRSITIQMCGEFFHGNANYHTDQQASKALGFRDVVVGGRMTMAYAANILEDHFGDAWWQSGRIDLKFTNPTWPGDTITARGIATGGLDGDADRAGAFVWLSKDDDTVVLVAEASVAA